MIELKDSEIRIIGEKTPRSATPKEQRPADQKREPETYKAAQPEVPIHYPTRRRQNAMHLIDFEEYPTEKHNTLKYVLISVTVVVVAIFIAAVYITRNMNEAHSLPLPSEHQDVLQASYNVEPQTSAEAEAEEGQFEMMEQQNEGNIDQQLAHINMTGSDAGCRLTSVSINGIPMRIFTAEGATPELHIGNIDKNDPTIILAMQAADVRKDNGGIVGACVHQGKVMSEGLSKKGYVAIIDGKLNIGMSEHSPLFEQATQTQGDFFRQYPLVANGQIVDNVLKQSAIRRAICQRQNQHFVIVSETPVSFHDFSQALVDMKVENAVYLVGSKYAHGFCRPVGEEMQQWGESYGKKHFSKSITYLIWRK